MRPLMRNLVLSVLFLILSADFAYAQNYTSVTSTVKDPSGTVYVLGSYTIALVNTSTQQAQFGGNPSFQQVYAGSLDANGNLSITLPSNAVITPVGTQWAFNICANPGQIASIFPRPALPCFVSNQTVSGTSQVITFSATAIPLPAGSGSGCGTLPTSPNGVPQPCTSTPSGGVGQAFVAALAGVPTNAQTGVSYTIAATDRNGYVTTSNAGAIAVTLPQAGSGSGTNNDFTHNFAYRECNIGAGTATITPTTSTISYTTTANSTYTSAAAALALTTNQCASIFSDNTNYFANVYAAGAGGSGIKQQFASIVFSCPGSTTCWESPNGQEESTGAVGRASSPITTTGTVTGTSFYAYVSTSSAQPGTGSLVCTLFAGAVGSLASTGVSITVTANGSGLFQGTGSGSVTGGQAAAWQCVNNATTTSGSVTSLVGPVT